MDWKAGLASAQAFLQAYAFAILLVLVVIGYLWARHGQTVVEAVTPEPPTFANPLSPAAHETGTVTAAPYVDAVLEARLRLQGRVDEAARAAVVERKRKEEEKRQARLAELEAKMLNGGVRLGLGPSSRSDGGDSGDDASGSDATAGHAPKGSGAGSSPSGRSTGFTPLGGSSGGSSFRPSRRGPSCGRGGCG